jgi:hypothetical protein
MRRSVPSLQAPNLGQALGLTRRWQSVPAAPRPRRGGGSVTAQVNPIGPTPLIAELFVGALMYSTVAEVRAVLRFVEDADVDEPAATVLASVRALALRGTPPSPQLVNDDLRRRGKLTRSTAVWLNGATTSGACDSAARNYAAAVVAESFRNRVESFGTALTSMSASASEVEVGQLVERVAAGISGVAARLAELRGDING